MFKIRRLIFIGFLLCILLILFYINIPVLFSQETIDKYTPKMRGRNIYIGASNNESSLDLISDRIMYISDKSEPITLSLKYKDDIEKDNAKFSLKAFYDYEELPLTIINTDILDSKGFITLSHNKEEQVQILLDKTKFEIDRSNPHKLMISMSEQTISSEERMKKTKKANTKSKNNSKITSEVVIPLARDFQFSGDNIKQHVSIDLDIIYDLNLANKNLLASKFKDIESKIFKINKPLEYKKHIDVPFNSSALNTDLKHNMSNTNYPIPQEEPVRVNRSTSFPLAYNIGIDFIDVNTALILVTIDGNQVNINNERYALTNLKKGTSMGTINVQTPEPEKKGNYDVSAYIVYDPFKPIKEKKHIFVEPFRRFRLYVNMD